MNAIRIEGTVDGFECKAVDLFVESIVSVVVSEYVDTETETTTTTGSVYLTTGQQVDVDATNLAIVETAMGINTQQS